jgi:hypothetical protein
MVNILVKFSSDRETVLGSLLVFQIDRSTFIERSELRRAIVMVEISEAGYATLPSVEL